MEKEVLLETRNVIDDIYKNGLKEKHIKELYRLLGNKSIPLIFNNVLYTAAFNPELKYISINIEKLIKWLDEAVKDTMKLYDIKDAELLKSYLIVYALCHEIEHSNHKLISEKKKQPNYNYKVKAYRDIYSAILPKEYLLSIPIPFVNDNIRYIIYKINAYNFIFERSATIEGFNIASSIAELSNDREMLKYLISVRNKQIYQSYKYSAEGYLKYTYRLLRMMRRYQRLKFPSDMTLDEKAREGLELTEVERKKLILTLQKVEDSI